MSRQYHRRPDLVPDPLAGPTWKECPCALFITHTLYLRYFMFLIVIRPLCLSCQAVGNTSLGSCFRSGNAFCGIPTAGTLPFRRICTFTSWCMLTNWESCPRTPVKSLRVLFDGVHLLDKLYIFHSLLPSATVDLNTQNTNHSTA